MPEKTAVQDDFALSPEQLDNSERMELTSVLVAVGFGCYWAWNLSFLSIMLFSSEPQHLTGDLLMRLAMVAVMCVLQLATHLRLTRGKMPRRKERWPAVLIAVCALPLFAVLLVSQYLGPLQPEILIVAGTLFGVSSGLFLLSWGSIWSVVDRSKPFNRSTAKAIAWSFLLAGILMVFAWFAPAESSLLISILLYVASFVLRMICSRRLPKLQCPKEPEKPASNKQLKLFSRSRYMPLFMGVTVGGVLVWVNLALPVPTGFLLVAGGMSAGGLTALVLIIRLGRIPLLSTIERVGVPLIAAACIALLFVPAPFNYLIILVIGAVLSLYFIMHWNILLVLSYKHHLDPLDHFSQGAIAPLEGLALGWLFPTILTLVGFSPEQWLPYGVLTILFLAVVIPAVVKYRSNDAVEALSLSEASGRALLPDPANEESSPSDLFRRCYADHQDQLGAGGIGTAKGPWRARCLYLAEKNGLSPREIEVFFLLAKGRNAEFIHNELFISIYTAKTHGYRIYRKLGINSQQELINMVDQVELPE